MKSRNDKLETPCDIYVDMMKNPPVKKIESCQLEIDGEAFGLTGKIMPRLNCHTFFKRDKHKFEAAKSACKAYLDDYFSKAGFSSDNKEDHKTPRYK